MALRFRIDRSRGKALNLVHLVNIPLISYKMQDVRTFVDRVRLVLCNLKRDEVKDEQFMYQWLFEKFKQ